MQGIGGRQVRETFLWGVIVVLLGIIVAGFFLDGDKNLEVAKIEQHTIGQQEFVEELSRRYGTQLLHEIIEREAIQYEANRLALEVSEREIDKEIEKYRHNFSADAGDFESLFFYEYGMTLDQLREDIRYNLLLEKLATVDVRVSDAEMEKYYQENIYQFQEPEQLKIRRILLKDQAEATRVQEELAGGADFSALAMEVSEDRLTASIGGDMGYVNIDSMYIDHQILDSTLRLQVGESSQPFETYEGWNIVLLEERKEAKQHEFSEVKSLIFRELALIQAKPLNEFLQDLIAKLDIEVFEDNIAKNLRLVE